MNDLHENTSYNTLKKKLIEDTFNDFEWFLPSSWHEADKFFKY